MTKAHDLATLCSEHSKLDSAIARASARRHPDLDAIAKLKRRKLVLKDMIARLDESSDPWGTDAGP